MSVVDAPAFLERALPQFFLITSAGHIAQVRIKSTGIFFHCSKCSATVELPAGNLSFLQAKLFTANASPVPEIKDFNATNTVVHPIRQAQQKVY